MKYQWKAFSLFSFDFPFHGTHTLEKQKHISSLFVEEVAETEDIVVYAKFPSSWEYTTIWDWENESGKNAFSVFTEPRITSVDMNMYEIGEEAGSILVKNLAHPNHRIQIFTSEPCIFERETT